MVLVNEPRHAWRREPRAARRRRALLRFLGLAGALGLALAAALWLTSLLREPFGHPRVEFLFLTGADLSGNVDGYFDQPGVAFPAGEQAGLLRAREAVFGDAPQPSIALDRWRSASDMRSLGQRLVEPDLAAGDVALIHVVAAGVSEGGEARLCWNFGRSATTRRVRVAELVQQIVASTRATKLLILDAGNVEALPGEGMLVNEFPRLLEQEIEKTKDETLWVLCSHGVLETSHPLGSARRSVFGYYFEQALSGAADLNADSQVDLGELYDWVAHAVAGYVERRTGGLESQTPRLLWGGGSRLPETGLPVIVPVRTGNAAARARAATALESASTGTGAKEAPADATAAEKDSGAATADGSAPGNLLEEAWRLADQLRAGSGTLETPFDAAPRLFGEFTARLGAGEVLARGVDNVPPAELASELLPIVVPLRGITSNPPVAPATGSGLGTRLARELEPLALPALPLLSLALAEQLAEAHIRPLPEGLAELASAIDRFIVQDERTGFDEWLAKLKPEERRLAELDGIAALAQFPDVDWPLLRAALAARRLGERAAVRSLGSVGAAADDILRGDQCRAAGEKLLLDGIQRERSSRAAAAFESAAAAYRSAERRTDACRAAWRLKNELVPRAREYVRWQRAAARRSDTAGPEYDRVAEFLAVLKRFCEVVERQETGDGMELADLSLRLREIQRRIEASAAEERVQRLAATPSGPEDLAQIEGLLATTLIPAAMRPQLQAAAETAAAAVGLEAAAFDPRRKVAQPLGVIHRQRRCISQQVELELLLAQLAEVGEEEASGAQSRLEPLIHQAQIVRQCERERTEHPENTERRATWWQACAAFAQELAAWNRELPARLKSAAEAGMSDPDGARAARILRGVPRTLALISGRGRQGAAADELMLVARTAQWRELLTFLRQRAIKALPDAPQAIAGNLAATAESYRQAAAAVNSGPVLEPNPAASLWLSGTSELSLSQGPEGEVLVTIQNRRNVRKDAWLSIDYDPELLAVRPPVDYAVYREPAPNLAKPGSRDPAALDRLSTEGLAPSLNLGPGAQMTLRFVVRRRGSRTWPTRLIVKASGDDCAVRHECTVHVPAPEEIELLVEGPGNSSTATPAGFVLHPFPNQRTAFQLLLQNRGLPRTLDVELVALERQPIAAIPAATLPREQADALLRSLSVGPRLAAVAGFKLEGDGAPHAVSFAGPLPPDPDKPGPKKPPVAQLRFGMLLVIGEPASGRKIIKRLEIAPQRPRRYVVARVDYQPDAQIVDVSVRRRENAASPERIKVRCELGRLSDPATARRRTVAEIAAGQNETRFSLPVPTAVEGLRLAIAIDDYPRAFLYRVSSQLPGGEVFEDTGSLEVRLTTPEPQSQFACPVKYVEATVEVDAPPGSLPEAQDFWEVGIDKDLDRELVGDNAVRFAADRQARPELAGFYPGGRLAIDAEVGDFQVQLPAEGLCNQRAQIVAHASVLARNVWSAPVEIVLDGEGPRVTRMTAGDERPLVAGQVLDVAATAQDAELSGVARVDVAFDLEGSGRFVKEPPPLPAALSPNGAWVAQLPTEKMPPGTYLILARAVDKVGNVGPYARSVVTLYSQEELDRQRAAIRVPLRGVVEFNKLPVPGVKVSLVPAEPDPAAAGSPGAAAEKAAAGKGPGSAPAEPIPPVKTDKDGMFVLPKVPLGKFKLQAEGIVRNKIRKAELAITVDEQTPFAPAPRLKLPYP